MSRFGRSFILVALLSLTAAFAVQAVEADDPPADDTIVPAGTESLNKGRMVIDPNG